MSQDNAAHSPSGDAPASGPTYSQSLSAAQGTVGSAYAIPALPGQSATSLSTSSRHSNAHGGRDLQRHKDSRPGDIVYKCPWCGEGFALAEMLKHHIDEPCLLTPPGVNTVVYELPAAPVSRHGRVKELRHVVDLLLGPSPARVAIRGSWGIGKTHLALQVLHDVSVAQEYRNHRFFVSCEHDRTAEALIEHLLMIFNLTHVPTNRGSPQDILIEHLMLFPKLLLCLDSFEMTWDADIAATEAFLYALVTKIDRLALIITVRGTVYPELVSWTNPLLFPLAPLSHDEMLKIWDDIRSAHDEYASNLIADMGGVPLPVTILAQLAEHESSENLYTRWKRERTSMLKIHGGASRLTNVDASIELTLCGPRFGGCPLAAEILHLICMLPQGLRRIHIDCQEDLWFDRAHPNFPFIGDTDLAVSILEDCAILKDSARDDEFLVATALLRDYVLTHQQISSELCGFMLDIYRQLPAVSFDDHPDLQAYLRDIIYPESENIRSILRLSMTCKPLPPSLQQALVSVASLLQLNQEAQFIDTSFLLEAITLARSSGFRWAEAHLLQALAQSLFRAQGCTSEVVSVFTSALDLHRDLGDTTGVYKCMLALGGLHMQMGRLQCAEQMLSSALEAIRADPIRSMFDGFGLNYARKDEAYALCGLGCIHMLLRRFSEAEKELQSALALKGVIKNCHKLMKDADDALARLRILRQDLEAERMCTSDMETSSGPSDEGPDTSDTQADDLLPPVPPLPQTSRPPSRSSVKPSDAYPASGHRGPTDLYSVLRHLMINADVAVEVIPYVSTYVAALLLPLASSPEEHNRFVSTIVSILGRFTCYQRLCEADLDANGEGDSRFDSIRKSLLKEWMVVVTILAAVTAIGSAGFVAAPGSIVPIGTPALFCLIVSASAAALGFVVCVVLLFQCWNIDAARFRKLALGIYEDYCFFAIMAATPALSLLLAGLFVALFVLIAAWRVWPAAVAALAAVFTILVGMQYIIKGGEILITHER
ncbi:unnamed protein product [Peniophora sp. CBMAI 1063]|nr:unnamed protein product [Peniophora sp. CBMAI 1063]